MKRHPAMIFREAVVGHSLRARVEKKLDMALVGGEFSLLKRRHNPPSAHKDGCSRSPQTKECRLSCRRLNVNPPHITPPQPLDFWPFTRMAGRKKKRRKKAAVAY